jgi:hypothetical protein
MMETIFMLVATIVIFSIYLVVYLIKDRSDSHKKKGSTCARCDCHRSQKQHECPPSRLKQIKKESGPCSAGR